MTKHPSLPADFFATNRKNLLSSLPETSLALLQSAEWMLRNGDVRHAWRQDSNFFYFTGVEQPGCSLLLIPGQTGNPEEILFIPPVDPTLEKWEGEMLTPDLAKNISGIKNVQTTDQFLPSLFRSQKWRDYLYCEVNDVFPDQPLTQQHLLLHSLGERLPGLSLKKLAPIMAKLRVTKNPLEIEQLRKSLDIIRMAVLSAMRKMKPGLMEYEIEAELAYHYIANGCSRLGFETIVASGKNATILHYVNNAARIEAEELVLMDTGGEYGMYSGDITRVVPANGRFSPRQRTCYQTVLDSQKAVISAIKPGMSYRDLVKIAGEIQGELLVENGFIDNPKEHSKVTLHRIGHYLGLDVHDVGNTEWKLEPGTVITIEPGLYLKEEGIGIRIEDNILITENGVEILSASIPKEIDEIEEICKN